MSRLTLPTRPGPTVPLARTSTDAARTVIGARVRSVPHVAAGAAMVVGAVAVLGFAYLKVGGRVPVLVVDKPLQAGQTITGDDLRVVDIAPGTGTSVVAARDEPSIVGKPAAVPLAAGQILGPQLVGAAQFPPVGEAVAAVSLKAGAFPPHLVVGSHVVVVDPATGNAAAQVVARDATVTEVGAADQQGMTVVSLLTDEPSAKAISSVPDGLALYVVPVGEAG